MKNTFAFTIYVYCRSYIHRRDLFSICISIFPHATYHKQTYKYMGAYAPWAVFPRTLTHTHLADPNKNISSVFFYFFRRCSAVGPSRFTVWWWWRWLWRERWRSWSTTSSPVYILRYFYQIRSMSEYCEWETGRASDGGEGEGVGAGGVAAVEVLRKKGGLVVRVAVVSVV